MFRKRAARDNLELRLEQCRSSWILAGDCYLSTILLYFFYIIIYLHIPNGVDYKLVSLQHRKEAYTRYNI